MKSIFKFLFLIGSAIFIANCNFPSDTTDNIYNLSSLSFLEQQNIIYAGCDNRLKISPIRFPNDSIEIMSKKIEVTKIENGLYNLRAKQLGTGTILIKIGDFQESYQVKIKQIPSPIARLGRLDSGATISIGELKAQGGIGAWIDNLDINAHCKIISFSVTQIEKDGNQKTVENSGARFGANATGLLEKAKSGDIYLFENIKSRCPGDDLIDAKIVRQLNDLIIRVK